MGEKTIHTCEKAICMGEKVIRTCEKVIHMGEKVIHTCEKIIHTCEKARNRIVTIQSCDEQSFFCPVRDNMLVEKLVKKRKMEEKKVGDFISPSSGVC
jgi:hypothetical protein